MIKSIDQSAVTNMDSIVSYENKLRLLCVSICQLVYCPLRCTQRLCHTESLQCACGRAGRLRSKGCQAEMPKTGVFF